MFIIFSNYGYTTAAQVFWILSAMTIFIKTIIIILFVFIFFALGSALFFLVKDKGDSKRIVKALSWRIGLSFFVFIVLMIAFAMGWITPHQIV